jgi:PAS domain S-box-containing protein
MQEEVDSPGAGALPFGEARLWAILDNSPAVIYVKDWGGRFLFVNRRFEDLFHVTRAGVLGKTDDDLFPKEFADRFRENDRRVWETGDEIEAEEVAPHDDGPHTYVSVKFPLRDAVGRIDALCGISTDVTDRKRAEENLWREKGFSDAALDSLPGVFYLFDASGRFVRWNKNLERVTGYSAEEIREMSPLDFFAGSDRAVIAARIREVFAVGESTAEADFLAKDGSATPYLFTGRRVLLGGEPCLVGMGVDITEIRRSQRALSESEARLSGILASAMDAIIVVDESQRVTTFNPAAERMFGYTANEALGRRIDFLLPARFRRSHRGHVRRFGESGVTSRSMATLGVLLARRRSGEEFPIEATISQSTVGGRTVYTAVVRDITERRHLEASREAEHARDRRIAASLQRSLLHAPPEEQFAGLGVAAVYEAAWDEASVGGDFFDIFALDGDAAPGMTRVALALGDVSGKGLAAATHTAEIKYALRAFLREDPDAARGLSRLNRHVCNALRLDWQGGFAFTTLCLAIIDPATGTVELALAGSEPPCIARAAGSVESVEPRLGGLPLGIAVDEAYTAIPLQLGPEDTLLIFTDGITEARRGRVPEFFGYERVLELARGASAAGPRQTGHTILEAARDFAGGSLRDDVCLLLARRR